MSKNNLVEIDQTEHDTIAMLEMLLDYCKQNKVSGIIYAVSLKHRRSSTAICGATGWLADDAIQAAGLASMLSHKFSQEAVEKYQGR
ncbi:MAG: hypothetical protein M0P19_08885 [Nevskia sp.]|nr:hypothetical protein [Nevskia sp.]MCK9386100.1 hypothetical protein [Nevskia sp.]